MLRTAKRLASIIGPNDLPVFDSAADLAREIAALSGSKYTDPRLTTGLLGQVFRGEKRCPAALMEAALAAMEVRSSSWPIVESRLSARTALQTLLSRNQSTSGPWVACDPAEFAAVLDAIRSCNCLEAVLPFGIAEDPCSRQVAKIITTRLELMEATPPGSFRATFYVDDEVKGQAIWDTLISLALSGGDPGEAETRDRQVLTKLHELSASSRVRVYVLPSSACIFPALRCEFSEDSAVGFNIYVINESELSICRMSEDTLFRWKRSLRTGILTRAVDAKAVPFELPESENGASEQ